MHMLSIDDVVSMLRCRLECMMGSPVLMLCRGLQPCMRDRVRWERRPQDGIRKAGQGGVHKLSEMDIVSYAK